MTTLPASADSRNVFEDLSGIDITQYANPYNALIEASLDDPVNMQDRYEAHRVKRNEQQKAKLLSAEFSGLIIDPILDGLEHKPGFKDPRHCLVFWARPPPHIRELAKHVQEQLQSLAPNLWLMPHDKMHMTALEITHSRTSPEIHSIISAIGPAAIAQMTDYPFSHRARLVKPLISYDGAALALSFLPAANEDLPYPGRAVDDDKFTYHHLRRDLFGIAQATGITVDSRYVVPSSHITIARFLVQNEHDTPEKMTKFLERIDQLNAWLQENYWPKEGAGRREKGEWIVGEGKGLDCREGQLWYGGGNTVRLGKGFEVSGPGGDAKLAVEPF